MSSDQLCFDMGAGLPPVAESVAQKKVYAQVDPSRYVRGGAKVKMLACFRDHVGEVLTGKQLEAVAGIPRWHQRLDEIRDLGYEVLTRKDRAWLTTSEYLMLDPNPREITSRRVTPSADCWQTVLERDGHRCVFDLDGVACRLAAGERDPNTNRTVTLTADHRRPHALDAAADPDDPDAWQVLCERHQHVKRHYFDEDGRVQVLAAARDAARDMRRALLEQEIAFWGADHVRAICDQVR